MQVEARPLLVPAPHQELHATYYPAATRECCLIVQGAVGMDQRRYAALAAHLVGQGICVLQMLNLTIHDPTIRKHSNSAGRFPMPSILSRTSTWTIRARIITPLAQRYGNRLVVR